MPVIKSQNDDIPAVIYLLLFTISHPPLYNVRPRTARPMSLFYHLSHFVRGQNKMPSAHKSYNLQHGGQQHRDVSSVKEQ